MLGVLLANGMAFAPACQVLGSCQAPPGRMQVVGGGALPLAIVDYAHTPDALDNALRAARAHCAGRLLCVFGCGGDRDRGKRAQMGQVAESLADELYITDDNPRTESPERIVADILGGLRHPERAPGAARPVASIAAAGGPRPPPAMWCCGRQGPRGLPARGHSGARSATWRRCSGP